MSTVPLDRQRLERYDASTRVYTLAIITDEDQDSQVALEDGQTAWQSRIRYDRLYRYEDPATGSVTFDFDEIPAAEGGEHQLISLVAEGGRGAEFSELVQFGQRLVAFDDRTGLVCEVRDGHNLIPRQILMTGSGDERFKGFKGEWATLQGDTLVVGSHGKRPEEEWIKCLDRGYRVQSRAWHEPYRRMREALGVQGTPGYVVHEAAEWHPLRERWYFFPRKISTEPFDEAVDERERGGNRMLVADAAFESLEVITVGERVPERGVSSLKFLPGHPDECVALKSVEWGDVTETYLFCFDLQGNILKADTFVGAYKCEGVEII